MFKSLASLLYSKNKEGLRSRKTFIFNTDFEIKVSDYFRFDSKVIAGLENYEDIKEQVRKELYNSGRAWGSLVSRTSNARLRIISIATDDTPDRDGKVYTNVHLELVVSYCAKYVARDHLEAIEKAKIGFKADVVSAYLYELEQLVVEVVGEVKVSKDIEITIFEGEEGFDTAM